MLGLLWLSTAVDFQVARRMEHAREESHRRGLLLLSVVTNLGVLGFFKYANFALDTLVRLGMSAELASPMYVEAAVPLGISFYTFQTLGYTIEVYRGKQQACQRPIDFALFVSFFPQLIAGPVLRAADFLPQIERRPRATRRQVIDGVELLMVGLFKKVVLADSLALMVDPAFTDPAKFSGAALMLASVGFIVQLYCDFSGYSTIARGLGKLLGYELPRNFDFPLLANDPIEYRRRWHMTVSRWFGDYVYRPLGGDRRGELRTMLNTVAVLTAASRFH